MTKKTASESAITIAAAESRKEALLDAAARDSPVLMLVAKRLRAAKKKAKRAEELETLKATGREINADQEEALRAKGRNLAAIEELEKLIPLLKEAVAEEVSQKLSAKSQELKETITAAAAEKAADEARVTAEAHEVEKAKAAAIAEELKTKIEEATEKAAAEEVRRAEEKAAVDAKIAELQASEQSSIEESIMRLLQLIYFSKLFSSEGRAENDYIHQMERDACLTYKSTVSFAGDSLAPQDLDAICFFGKLVSTRPSSEIVSHETALERCKALALDWVNAAETSIPQLNATVNELVVKFERIVGSTYYSVKPEMRAPEMSGAISAPYREANVPTPPGKDINASTSYSSGGGYGPAPAPAVSHASNNAALQQLFYPRPAQASSEGQAGAEGLQNGFAPPSSTGFTDSITSAYQPPASNSLNPISSASSTFGSGSAASTMQPPGFKPGPAQKPAATSDARAQQFYEGVFQGPTFGGITGAELAAPSSAAPTGNGAVHVYTSSAEPPASVPPTEATSTPAKQLLDDVDVLIDKAPERKGSYTMPTMPRPRATSSEYSRGRGQGRGRSGAARGEYFPRGGGGRRGPPPGRGYRGGGRGRDFSPQFNPQPVSGGNY